MTSSHSPYRPLGYSLPPLAPPPSPTLTRFSSFHHCSSSFSCHSFVDTFLPRGASYSFILALDSEASSGRWPCPSILFMIWYPFPLLCFLSVSSTSHASDVLAAYLSYCPQGIVRMEEHIYLLYLQAWQSLAQSRYQATTYLLNRVNCITYVKIMSRLTVINSLISVVQQFLARLKHSILQRSSLFKMVNNSK